MSDWIDSPAPTPVYRISAYVTGGTGVLIALLNGESDLGALLRLRAMTDNVARQAREIIASMSPGDRYTGPLDDLVMLPVVRPFPARFNDATFGAWYAGDGLDTAWEEKAHHLRRWLLQSPGQTYDLRQQVVVATISEDMVDLREAPAEMYDPDDYHHANAFARELRATKAPGVLYRSVRHEGGLCVGIFRPAVIANVSIVRDLLLTWDGKYLAGFAEIGGIGLFDRFDRPGSG